MDQGSDIRAPVHDVHRGLALLREGAELMLGARTWSLPPEQVREALAEVSALASSVEAARLHLVRASVAGDDGAHPGRETAQWVASELRVDAGRARADVANAALTDPEDGDLRELGVALGEGRVTREHVDVARRALRRVPVGLLSRERGRLAANLTDNARRFTPRQAAFLAEHLVSTLTPADSDTLDPLAAQRRFGTCAVDTTGMLRLTAQLAGEDAAAFRATFEHLTAPGRLPDPEATPGTLVGVGDTRSSGQRGADALALMARLAASARGAGTRAGEPAHVVVHATPEQLAWVPGATRDATDDGAAPAGRVGQGRAEARRLSPDLAGCAADPDDAGLLPPGHAVCEQTGPLPPALLQRIACEAVIDVVTLDCRGAVVGMTTSARYATRSQRRALAARDGGCARPGCTAPPSWCDAHHAVWWTRGGATTVANLVLLCPSHHTEIHCGEWTVTMRHGVPWFTPPAWVDGGRTPLRNALPAAATRARDLGQQLWFDGLPSGRPVARGRHPEPRARGRGMPQDPSAA